MANWWEVHNWDWGGMADGFQANVFTPTVLYRQATGQKNILGDIGHNFLGGKEQQRADATQERLDQLTEQLATQQNPYENQPNPFEQGNAGLMNQLSLQDSAIQRQYADAVDDARRSLAMRGALGSAQETSLLRQIGVDKARARSGAEAQTRANAYDKAANWQLGMLGSADNWNRYRSSMLRGDYADQRDRYQQQADAPKQALASFANTGLKAIGTGAAMAAAPATGGASLAAIPAIQSSNPISYPSGGGTVPLSGLGLERSRLGNPYPQRGGLF